MEEKKQMEFFILKVISNVLSKRNIHPNATIYPHGIITSTNQYCTPVVMDAIEFLIQCHDSVLTDICSTPIESYFKEKFCKDTRERKFLEFISIGMYTFLNNMKNDMEAPSKAYESIKTILFDDYLLSKFTLNKDLLHIAAIEILVEDEHKYKETLREIVADRIRLADTVKSSLKSKLYIQAHFKRNLEEKLTCSPGNKQVDDIRYRRDRWETFTDPSPSQILNIKGKHVNELNAGDAFAPPYNLVGSQHATFAKQLELESTLDAKSSRSFGFDKHSFEYIDYELKVAETFINEVTALIKKMDLKKLKGKNCQSLNKFDQWNGFEGDFRMLLPKGEEKIPICESMQSNQCNINYGTCVKETEQCFREHFPELKVNDFGAQKIEWSIEFQSNVPTCDKEGDSLRQLIPCDSKPHSMDKRENKEHETLEKNLRGLDFGNGKNNGSGISVGNENLSESETDSVYLLKKSMKDNVAELQKDPISTDAIDQNISHHSKVSSSETLAERNVKAPTYKENDFNVVVENFLV